MTKTEEALIEAIESGEQDKALELLTTFSELKSSTDEQSNAYFDKVTAMGEVDAELDELDEELEEIIEVEVEVEIEEAIEAPRVEKRGKKPVPKSRKEINEAFNHLQVLCVDYLAEVKKDNNAQSKFARRMTKTLHILGKNVVRR